MILLAVGLSIVAISLPPNVDSAASGGRVEPTPMIVDKVERSRLERVVRELSGADTIYVNEEPAVITTRYVRSNQMDIVRSWLINEVRSAGYEPAVQRFVVTIAAANLTGSAVSGGFDTLWVADVNGSIYRVTASQGWSRFEKCGSIDGRVYDLEVDHSGRLWAACGYSNSLYGGLYLSTDGGASWALRASGTSIQALVTVTFKDEQFGMAFGWNGTVLRTADAGESWFPGDPQKLSLESVHRSAANGPRHYWCITDYGSLWETQDLGDTWRRRFPVWTPIADLGFYGESFGLIVGNGRVYYTRDGGQSWTLVSIPMQLEEVSMIDSVRAVASGANGEIWVTENGGSSWSRLGAECDVAAAVESIEYAGGGWVWFTGMNLARRIHWGESLPSCAAYQLADTLWGKNISFRKEGVTKPDTVVLLTAHYDSYSADFPLECAPGADDNATGVAAVLECARALRDERTERSVEFVLFDAEELGLIGSRYYANHLDADAVYEGVLNLDMLGYEANATMSAVVSWGVINVSDSILAVDTVLATRLRMAVDSFGLDLEVEFVGGAERLTSDHIAFSDVGIPGVLLAEGRRSELTPYYHSCDDVADALNYPFFEVCTKAALGAIAFLAGLLPSEVVPKVLPKHLALYQNHPNPFSSETVVSYALPFPSVVELAVYDISGRRVAVIDRGPKGKGAFERTWSGRDARGEPLRSGIYFLRLSSGADEAVKKIVIVR